MKKTPKKLLGLLGLLVVVAITIVAAVMPNPEASATSSVTDTINVRVVGVAPNVDIIGIESGETTTTAPHDIKVTYEVVDKVSVTLKYTDKDGNVTTQVLADDVVDYVAGEYIFNLDLRDYGYGDYEIIASGEGVDGVKDETITAFSYVPVTGAVSEDPETGNTVLDLDYDPYDESGVGTGEVDSVVINVYDEDGNLVTPLSPIHVNAPDKQVPLSFDGLPEGNYTIELIAYNIDGEELYKKYLLTYYYPGDIVVPETGTPDAPDTGGLFGRLNISNADFLATGLLIFFLAGICGVVFILKKDRKSNKRK